MTDERTRGPYPDNLAVWAGVCAGMVLWAIHLSGMAALPTWVCGGGHTWMFHALTVLTAGGTALALIPCHRAWRSTEGAGGLAFIGAMGLLVNAVSLLAILAEWVPVFVLDPCVP